ncbi:nucleotidyltransferase domain-containing protein [Agrococcus sp. KRD186]|uniref:nucleotidyltransferase domain-containing protein n=1 Tax=Agrococcus sp. KRD186 TaxID=2729730 RepID=UPI0019CFC07A|nr:nucleotidyltransferase domain-containing protein [Agrococcus sp. KRD186]
MSLADAYRQARHDEDVARLRRILALRAMVASGQSQRQIAVSLGISQPAVSQQLKATPDLDSIHPKVLLTAAGPVLKALAAAHGYTRLAAFGSVARHEARADSDIDLLVEAPHGTSTFSFLRFRQMIEQTLGRSVDLASYGGLKNELDSDILHEAVLL